MPGSRDTARSRSRSPRTDADLPAEAAQDNSDKLLKLTEAQLAAHPLVRLCEEGDLRTALVSVAKALADAQYAETQLKADSDSMYYKGNARAEEFISRFRLLERTLLGARFVSPIHSDEKSLTPPLPAELKHLES